jgi:hypothetical protein
MSIQGPVPLLIQVVADLNHVVKLYTVNLYPSKCSILRSWTVPDGPALFMSIQGPVPLLIQVVANLNHVVKLYTVNLYLGKCSIIRAWTVPVQLLGIQGPVPLLIQVVANLNHVVKLHTVNLYPSNCSIIRSWTVSDDPVHCVQLMSIQGPVPLLIQVVANLNHVVKLYTVNLYLSKCSIIRAWTVPVQLKVI